MAEDPAALERFYLEARAVAALDHINIVRAYDVDQDDDLHFLVMEYVDGDSLHDLIRKNGPLAPAQAADFMRQAALGLQHAHEFAGLVHRDVKPGNLVVDRAGVVKILDLGLAKFFHEEERRSRTSTTRRYSAPRITWRRSRSSTATRSISGPTSIAWGRRSTIAWPARRPSPMAPSRRNSSGTRPGNRDRSGSPGRRCPSSLKTCSAR